MTTRVSEHKRQYSIAFSETPVRVHAACSLTPVSKLIKEQQYGAEKTCFTNPKRPTTPAELENSLRRLSVQEEASPRASLFGDTPARDDSGALIPFHEVTLQANRLLTYPPASHQTLTCLFSDVFRSLFQSEVETVQEIFRRAFHTGDGSTALSIPPLQSALEGVDRLLQELNQSSRVIKEAFKSQVAFLERQPDEAHAQRLMAQFFTNVLVQRQRDR